MTHRASPVWGDRHTSIANGHLSAMAASTSVVARPVQVSVGVTRRTWKIVGWTYLVKTVLIAAAWIAIPDLPERASAKAHAVWATVFESGR